MDQCFQVELKEGYKESIRMFEKKYRELGITVTPKVIFSLREIGTLPWHHCKCSGHYLHNCSSFLLLFNFAGAHGLLPHRRLFGTQEGSCWSWILVWAIFWKLSSWFQGIFCLCDLFKFKNIIFQIEWEKVKVDSSHPEFGERLKAAISAYNAKHIWNCKVFIWSTYTTTYCCINILNLWLFKMLKWNNSCTINRYLYVFDLDFSCESSSVW